MTSSADSVWDPEPRQRLATALTQIGDVSTMQLFLRDVMTEVEIVEISARFEAARMLRAGSRYTEIIAATGLSSRTIARISEWLRSGRGGYDAALTTVSATPSHA